MSRSRIPCEFKYRLAQDMRRFRLEHGYATVYDLAEALKTGPNEVMALETGDLNNFKMLFRLARLYKKKLRIEFF